MRTKFKIGFMRAEIGASPPKNGKIKRMRSMVPYLFEMDWNSYAISLGSIPKRIFCPSSGPMGNRLKMAIATLVMING